ncbi:hypothetical protein NDU88_005890 [Pleurodeles waltl]|uniref:Uncharacterized protein n=1 Tax=Pleurodeles waltl TaxID=8319 RepID=A0AAV7WZ60_PLEWA|nr:hypothetical protein NDU88_005890 [Pleurodeles waltl]
MAAATGERAPAFTSEELEKLVDGVLPQYALLYGPPDQQVSTPGAHGMGYACVDWGGCQRPSEDRDLACHRQGSPELGGPQQTGHPLPQDSRHKGHHQAEEIWHRSTRELQDTRPRWAQEQTPRAPVIRRARGAPRRGPLVRAAKATRPRMGAP